jgi:hypothetical protein
MAVFEVCARAHDKREGYLTDVFVDNVLVVPNVPYLSAFQYAGLNMKPGDTYVEPGSNVLDYYTLIAEWREHCTFSGIDPETGGKL